MAVTAIQIGVSRSVKVAAGSAVIGEWPVEMTAPTSEALKAKLSTLGETWVSTPLLEAGISNCGITLARDISEYELATAYANANAGRAAVIAALKGDELETAIDYEQLSAEANATLQKVARDGLDAARSALWWAKWMPWIIGGVLVIGAAAVVYFAVQKARK